MMTLDREGAAREVEVALRAAPWTALGRARASRWGLGALGYTGPQDPDPDGQLSCKKSHGAPELGYLLLRRHRVFCLRHGLGGWDESGTRGFMVDRRSRAKMARDLDGEKIFGGAGEPMTWEELGALSPRQQLSLQGISDSKLLAQASDVPPPRSSSELRREGAKQVAVGFLVLALLALSRLGVHGVRWTALYCLGLPVGYVLGVYGNPLYGPDPPAGVFVLGLFLVGLVLAEIRLGLRRRAAGDSFNR